MANAKIEEGDKISQSVCLGNIPKLLEPVALASAYAGSNSKGMFLNHYPKKPKALKELKKF